MMDQSTPLNKLLRVLQFRKHLKEITSACKRINQDACYEFVSQRHPTSSKSKKIGSKFHLLRPKISHAKVSKTRKESCSSSQPAPNDDHANSTTGHRVMIVKQSYKPLHSKCNRNTIAVTKDALVKTFYTVSNWVFIEIIETGQTGFIPLYCLEKPVDRSDPSETQNNLSLFNVSLHDKSLRQTGPPSPGRFISSIGPCQHHLIEAGTYSRPKQRTETFRSKDQSNLSRQISNISLHATDHDAYGTLNLTPCKSLSMSILDSDATSTGPSGPRLRVMKTYQKQYVGDISVLESEVVTQIGMYRSGSDDWRLVRRGDGRQGYIPRQIATPDQHSH